MKRLLLGFLVLFAFAAQAQIVPSIPYTLTNGSLADATQVMGNFNTIVTDVNANAATNGANTNITAITGLTTPLANTYGGTVIYTGGTTGGSANVQTLATVVPNNYANTAGNIVTGVAGFTNTTSPTLAVNAQTAKQTAVNTPLGLISTPANTLVTGQGFLALFDGTYFEILSAPPNSVANSQLALMSNSTLKGNISGGSATPSDLTLASVAISANLVTHVKRQVITATGGATYTPCTGLIYGDYELWGAGGGGGGTNTTSGASGAGGGAGGYSRKVIAAATIGASQTVTLGTGGTAGASGGGTGGTGVTSTLGALLTAAGGVGGVGSTSASSAVSGGAGGAGSYEGTTTVGMAGGNAGIANLSGDIGGNGGSTLLGGNGLGTHAADGASATANSGSGGGGGESTGSNQVGGVGGSGFFVATEYCNQ